MISNRINQVLHMYGKASVVGGEITVKHIDGKYDITVDIINHLQHHICAHYYGELRQGMIGYEIVTPIE
jgi:hypothetical protein